MKLTPHLCPVCGDIIRGTVDDIPATALLRFDGDTNTYEYQGETKVHWDGQRPLTVPMCDGLIVVVCKSDHFFPALLEE